MAPALSPAALQVLLGKMKEGFALILVGFILATTWPALPFLMSHRSDRHVQALWDLPAPDVPVLHELFRSTMA